jgi:hypothetical protein
MEKAVVSVTFESTELFWNTTGERGPGWKSEGTVGGALGGAVRGPAGGALGRPAEGAARGALGRPAVGAAGGATRKLEFTH